MNSTLEPSGRRAQVIHHSLGGNARGLGERSGCGETAAANQSVLAFTRHAAHPHFLLCGAKGRILSLDC